MRLLDILIQRELFDHLSSSRYVLTSIVCVVLCITSVVLMSQDYANRVERFGLSHHTYGESTIAKPPQPLSLMAKGIEEVIGRATIPQPPHNQPIAHFFNYYGEEHHLFDLFTTPDFVYVVGVVLSALAIFFAFDTVCVSPLTLERSLSEIGPDGVLLMLWNVLLFMGANIAFLRYDVR